MDQGSLTFTLEEGDLDDGSPLPVQRAEGSDSDWDAIEGLCADSARGVPSTGPGADSAGEEETTADSARCSAESSLTVASASLPPLDVN